MAIDGLFLIELRLGHRVRHDHRVEVARGLAVRQHGLQGGREQDEIGIGVIIDRAGAKGVAGQRQAAWLFFPQGQRMLAMKAIGGLLDSPRRDRLGHQRAIGGSGRAAECLRDIAGRLEPAIGQHDPVLPALFGDRGGRKSLDEHRGICRMPDPGGACA